MGQQADVLVFEFRAQQIQAGGHQEIQVALNKKRGLPLGQGLEAFHQLFDVLGFLDDGLGVVTGGLGVIGIFDQAMAESPITKRGLRMPWAIPKAISFMVRSMTQDSI